MVMFVLSLQVESGALLSPASDLSSPGEETAAGALGIPCSKQGDARHLAEAMGAVTSFAGGGGGGGGGLVGGSPGTSGMGGPLAGASPPSTPDLPSPVDTVKVTKSRLIKEGLKVQIRTKLQAAGVDTADSLLDETKVFKDGTCDVSTAAPRPAHLIVSVLYTKNFTCSLVCHGLASSSRFTRPTLLVPTPRASLFLSLCA